MELVNVIVKNTMSAILVLLFMIFSNRSFVIPMAEPIEFERVWHTRPVTGAVNRTLPMICLSTQHGDQHHQYDCAEYQSKPGRQLQPCAQEVAGGH